MGERRHVTAGAARAQLTRDVPTCLRPRAVRQVGRDADDSPRESHYPGGVSKGRLTRQELSWLLTQEAQNAAERLRMGVKVLRTQAPPPPSEAPQDPSGHLDASLDALDDVMKMLSSLNQRSTSGPSSAPRRGRIDVAAILYEISPDARVSIEPGSGTEVYGEEADMRRMLQVLLGHGSGQGAQVTVRRDGDDVRVCVLLGPDSSPTAETERAWLSRMALRYGGRHELDGASEMLVFPAEGAHEKREREKLQRELDEARKQGEVYARELAAMFDRGEEVTATSTAPPPPGPSRPADRFATITKLCAGVAAELRATLVPAAKELAAMREHEVKGEQLDTLRRRISRAREVTASVSSVGSVPADELPAEIALRDVVRGAVNECASFADREGVRVEVRITNEDRRAYVRVGPRAMTALARELVAHAVQASPRGGVVEVTIIPDDPQGPRLHVDDAGPPLPASARRAFLALETHAGQYGRPSGLPIFMAAELASCIGARLELSDSQGGGLRVSVTFAKS
jgi:hypothetical protein